MTEMSPKAISLAACLLMGLGSIAAAHHSSAAYDHDHLQTVEGTVRQVNWTSPHITFVIQTDAKEGPQAGTWVYEASYPGNLNRSGWTKESLQPGDHAVFTYAPLRDGTPGGYLLKATLPNGRELTYELKPKEKPSEQ